MENLCDPTMENLCDPTMENLCDPTMENLCDPTMEDPVTSGPYNTRLNELDYYAQVKKGALIGGVVVGVLLLIIAVSVYCSYSKGKRRRKERKNKPDDWGTASPKPPETLAVRPVYLSSHNRRSWNVSRRAVRPVYLSSHKRRSLERVQACCATCVSKAQQCSPMMTDGVSQV
ncbi:hypothetical protein ACOMHN_051815 [Nucella lapillus]